MLSILQANLQPLRKSNSRSSSIITQDQITSNRVASSSREYLESRPPLLLRDPSSLNSDLPSSLPSDRPYGMSKYHNLRANSSQANLDPNLVRQAYYSQPCNLTLNTHTPHLMHKQKRKESDFNSLRVRSNSGKSKQKTDVVIKGGKLKMKTCKKQISGNTPFMKQTINEMKNEEKNHSRTHTLKEKLQGDLKNLNKYLI
ncbi:hypothetical protein FGO68_gene12335 [Halteria grandinella]|uniref:Uncharacterized protein n=1 Tax=Halteria grandinella TaxID=5974 RepID=A0A8J8NCH2_HALGN|nr:hypothetical protein FGO68_gene12335 [Halteria grandinella]